MNTKTEYAGQPPINVCFFMLTVSTWKYHNLYIELLENEKFKPIVVITPLINRGEDKQREEIELSKIYCEKNHYNYVIPINDDDLWYDIKSVLQPDVVFFSNPNAITHAYYCLEHFSDRFTCYLPYSIRIDTLYQYSYNSVFMNTICRHYCETPFHLRLARQHSALKAQNAKLSGHPIIDQIRECASSIPSVWKGQSHNKKKVVWAPHWTIKGHQTTTLDWSSFLDYSSFMVEMANKYVDSIQFSFKPHPFLKSILENKKLWGKDKTRRYFETWEELPNGQVDNGDYVTLFSQSDALIHDSGSFSVEYLELNKPVLYAKSRNDTADSFNELGKEALKMHYIANEKQDIKDFLEHTVLNQKDGLLEERIEFRKTYLTFNERSSSNTIVNDLTVTLINNKQKSL